MYKIRNIISATLIELLLTLGRTEKDLQSEHDNMM